MLFLLIWYYVPIKGVFIDGCALGCLLGWPEGCIDGCAGSAECWVMLAGPMDASMVVHCAGLLPNSSVFVVWEGTLGGGPKVRLLGVVVVSVRVPTRDVTGEALRVAVGLGGDLERGPKVRTEWVWVRCGSGRLGGRLNIALVGDANLDRVLKATKGR